MHSREERLRSALDSLLGSSSDIEAAALVSGDGLPMASTLPSEAEEDRLAAMSSALLSLGERASMGLGRGELQEVFVEGRSGYVFLMAAGPAVLVAITKREAKAGLVLFEMRRVANKIEAALTQDAEDYAIPEAMPPTPPPPPPPAHTPAENLTRVPRLPAERPPAGQDQGGLGNAWGA